MNEHPGNFWPCLWLVLLLLSSCDIQMAINKNTDAVKALAQGRQ